MEIPTPAEKLSSLLVELFLAIKLIAGYPVPQQWPAIQLLDSNAMRAMLCQGPCGDIPAFYLPGRGVFVNARLDFDNDVSARSILLHELVHHVQELSGKFDRIASQCDRWYSKELEAYSVQNQFLRQSGEKRRYLVDSLPQMCADGMTMRTPSAARDDPVATPSAGSLPAR